MSGTLTACQDRALDEIMSAYRPGARHLLTGYAGTGKTYLMSSVAEQHRRMRRKVVLTAPTHKAVSVLRRKVAAAGLDLDCITIHSLLGLQPKADKAGTKLIRRKGAKIPAVDVVVVDEASMIGLDLIHHIERWLSQVGSLTHTLLLGK